jgi:hypothetical protein
MPYKMSWLVDKRIIYTRMYGHVTSDEMAAYNQEMETFVQHSELLVHTLTNATDTTGTDMGLRDLQNTSFSDVANLGWAIYVSPSKINRFFASVITQLSHKRGRQFATLEEAFKFLHEMDDTLPLLSTEMVISQTETA